MGLSNDLRERVVEAVVLGGDYGDGCFFSLLWRVTSNAWNTAPDGTPQNMENMQVSLQFRAIPAQFPNSPPSPRPPHDDQVDSSAQALAWTKLRPAEPGMIGYYQRLAEEG
jgi:hypothetical protein